MKKAVAPGEESGLRHLDFTSKLSPAEIGKHVLCDKPLCLERKVSGYLVEGGGPLGRHVPQLPGLALAPRQDRACPRFSKTINPCMQPDNT